MFWLLFILTCTLTVLHLPLLPAYYNWLTTARQLPFPVWLIAPIDALDILYTLGMAVLGVLIIRRKTVRRIGWLILGIGFGSALLRLTGHYAVYSYVIAPDDSLPLRELAFWLQHWGWIPLIALEGIALPLLFPDGRLPLRWAWLFIVPITGWVVLGAFVTALHPWIPPQNYLLNLEVQAANPYASQWVQETFTPMLQTLGSYFFPLVQAGIVVACVSLLPRYLRADTGTRLQIKWFALALAINGLLFVARQLDNSLEFTAGLPGIIEIAFLVSNASLPIFLAIAIFRYRLYDIDLVINRTLVYTLLTAVIVAIYVVTVGGVGVLFQSGPNLTISLFATGLVAISFQGLRDRIQRGVNRLMFGQRDEPYVILSRLGGQLKSALTPEDLLPTITQTVATALKLPYVGITTQRGDENVLYAQHGEAKTPAETIPLIYQNELVGQLMVARRSPHEPLSPADQSVLENIAQQLGAVVQAVRLTADLQRSRERLVTAREEERRRLRRDLHDGLGPSLASQSLKLDAALDLLKVDLDDAAQLLTEVKTQSKTLIADIRRLVYDLRPPALDDLGLVGALNSAITQLRVSERGLAVTIDAPELPDLSAAVEVAAYRIALEAVTNVLKHASARQCSVRFAVMQKPSVLRIEVEDDGIGLPQPLTSGVGIQSMRERAEELGGAFSPETQSGGGTRIVARLPIQREHTINFAVPAQEKAV